MSNFETIEEHFRVAYEKNLMLDSQQMESRIAGFCDARWNYGEKGESFNLGNLGTSDPKEVDDKYGELPEDTVSRRRRHGFFKAWDDGKIIKGGIDEAREVSDPTNEIVVAQRAGLARRQDKLVYETILGTSYSGKAGTTTAALPAAQKIAVDDHDFDSDTGDVGLTLGKIIKARTKLRTNHVMGEIHCAASAAHISNLLAFENRMTSGEFNQVKTLVEGSVGRFYGIVFHEYNDLNQDSNDDDQVVFWVDRAIAFRQRILEAPDVWKRKDKRPHWYAYYQVDHAALRREDTAVIECACNPITLT